MKRKYLLFPFLLVFILELTLNACDTGLMSRSYSLELPPLPPVWEEIPGTVHWRLEWINPEGTWEVMRITGTDFPLVEVLPEWATPLMAFPYWPEQDIVPGTLRPAGGIFPFDVRDGRIRLSWRGGVAAWFYRELIRAGDGGNSLRGPQYFDWPRFRELLEGPALSEPIRADPWLADWRSIALRTIQSGFDRRRIVPQTGEPLPVPLPHGGPWIGPSPFGVPLLGETGEIALFPVTGSVDTYISPAGLLRCTQNVWIWLPWDAGPARIESF
jgi:hypothetical protein